MNFKEEEEEIGDIDVSYYEINEEMNKYYIMYVIHTTINRRVKTGISPENYNSQSQKTVYN